ncbi:MAG: phenylalanine 4-monooxygenase [Chitinophagales bacterium]
MIQQYDKYKQEDHDVWKILFDRQVDNLQDKASSMYIDCLKNMSSVLNAKHIPDFRKLDDFLLAKTGWSIEVVKGLIPVGDFFELLSNKRFPSSTWLRSRAQLDYLEEPDMFHDIFGHVPLLIHEEYSDLMHQIGKLSKTRKYDKEFVRIMERFYWFTIEFGLIKEKEQRKIYGAGIISSFGESKAIYSADIRVKPFSIYEVVNHDFTKSEMQQEYFEVDSIAQIRDDLSYFENMI